MKEDTTTYLTTWMPPKWRRSQRTRRSQMEGERGGQYVWDLVKPPPRARNVTLNSWGVAPETTEQSVAVLRSFQLLKKNYWDFVRTINTCTDNVNTSNISLPAMSVKAPFFYFLNFLELTDYDYWGDLSKSVLLYPWSLPKNKLNCAQ